MYLRQAISIRVSSAILLLILRVIVGLGPPSDYFCIFTIMLPSRWFVQYSCRICSSSLLSIVPSVHSHWSFLDISHSVLSYVILFAMFNSLYFPVFPPSISPWVYLFAGLMYMSQLIHRSYMFCSLMFLVTYHTPVVG